ncbi:type IV toxin-antitoxin system AbiEi family antitoxin domain-containing protein [Paenarthrobacter sp. NPDC018779]|uniref:type IV toxin-antitoxin system AbiEi family antitoxin domain-containing protein n=1 Tax=Paenarthrobacter sp. NPDC018779 TaxID=3364375 RepID=UPI0037C55236
MTYRRKLRELAFETHGVITTATAESVGVPAVEVRKLAARGALTRLGHGVYRMDEAPYGEFDEFAQAVALVGPGALLADETVLAAHHLAHVNLRRIRVASPRRVRSHLPETVEVIRRTVPAHQQASIEGVPAMDVESAILGSRGRIMTDRLVEAAQQACEKGLLDRKAVTRIEVALLTL